MKIRLTAPAGVQKREVLLAALTFVAGAVDAMSFVALGRVFTANMTGNIVLLGVAAGQESAAGTLRSAVALAGFVVFAFAGFLFVGRSQRRSWWARLTSALGIELVLLTCAYVVFAGDGPRLVVIALSAGAMGLQTAVAHRLAVPGITTTYVTGTLTGLMGQLAELTRPDVSSLRRFVTIVCLAAGASVEALVIKTAPHVPVMLIVLAVLVITAAVWRPEDKDAGRGGGGEGHPAAAEGARRPSSPG